MKVHLAGYNIDTDVLRELQDKGGKRQDVTPEVISASYARISRDPRPIAEIRSDARKEVEKARRSNSTIIFKMGHHSVAEHAVFNLDITGVSRYAMEEVEKFRLCSYTEKSQRYITLEDDVVLPEEIRGTKSERLFSDTLRLQNEAYTRYYDRLKDHVFKTHADLAGDERNHNLLEGWAKEDARYITSLATASQVGLTINARNLELMLRRFASHPLREVQELGKAIYDQISEVAPSIVVFYNSNDRDQKTYPELRKLAESLLGNMAPSPAHGDVELIEHTPDGDGRIAAALLHRSSTCTYQQCYELIRTLSDADRKKIFETAWLHMQLYDSMLREFEYSTLTYAIVLSAACFGQLKRHRMSTITAQEYNPQLGVTVPASIDACGLRDDFMSVVGRTNDAYEHILGESPLIAPYVLTNSHRRRVLLHLNVRELYHISRLRQDIHAQWDIRNVSSAMTECAKKVMPLSCALAGGKDAYVALYTSVFGREPQVTQARLPSSRKIR